MPRLPTLLIRKAHRLNPNLAALLPACRDLRSASNELRWLTEHVYASPLPWRADNRPGRSAPGRDTPERRLKKLCRDRGRGTPLQYVLGTEYFGSLELACTRGVLIPRPETADVVVELARRLHHRHLKSGSIPTPLRVLDLFAGSGCMSLLLHMELTKRIPTKQPATTALGLDISPRAIRLARHNCKRLGLCSRTIDNTPTKSPVSFALADILKVSRGTPQNLPNADPLLDERLALSTWDVVLANPPYVSQAELESTQVERSVRVFEPRQALVPPSAIASKAELSRLGLADADLFYPRILDIAWAAGAKVVLMETGGPEQAGRVRELAMRSGLWDFVCVWRDASGARGDPLAGKERAVVCCKGEGVDWINR